MLKCQDKEKNKAKQRVVLKQCNCWLLHLFGIEMRLEGAPCKSVTVFLGTNQFHLRINVQVSA